MDFYVSFVVFDNLVAIRANRLITIYNQQIKPQIFSPNEKFQQVSVNRTSLNIINPFVFLKIEKESALFNYVVILEANDGRKLGLPVESINKLHLVESEKIIKDKKEHDAGCWFISDDQKIKILHEFH